MVTKVRQTMSGRTSLVSFRIRREFPRPSPTLAKKYESYYLPDISDNVGRLYTMDASIHSLYQPAPRLCGTATTVKCPPGDNMGVKNALQMTAPGDVLVIDAQGFTDWCLGGVGMLLLAIKERGLKGLVINGAYRDVAQARELAFPIYAKAVAPFSGPKLGPFEINVPVCCGGVIVHPGDIVVADEEGCAVVPQDYAAAIADHLDALGNLEKDIASKTRGQMVEREAERKAYFEQLFKERGGVYLD